jgi:glycolate oxidase
MIPQKVLKELRTILDPNLVITDKTGLIAYSYDGQPESFIPDVVVHVSSREEIVLIVDLAVRHGVPVVARGAGSGMTGGSVPEQGGIVLNLERMKKILYLDIEDGLAFVQPGVITGDLQKAAEERGLFYPPEPASAQFSTIGGNVAESAGGLGCVKYGLTKDFIVGLEWVTSRGQIVRTGVYTDKDSPFDVGTLLTGSEGTLGIVTEISVRLIPKPEHYVTVVALFSTFIKAAQASNAVLASGVGPSVLEFMDGRCITAVRDYAKVDIPENTGALLLIELDGDYDTVVSGHEKLVDVLEDKEPLEIRSAHTPRERESLWKLRTSLSPSIAKIAPLKFNEDICVPISRIPEVCSYVEELGKRLDLKVVTFGHSGDGNVHVNFMTDWRLPEEVERVKQAIEVLFKVVVKRGGTLSGEHGIGIAKRPYLGLALDDATMAFEKKIKHAFDPETILNPGKIFPE